MKIADISIKRPVFATMMIVALVVFGLFAYPRIGVDLFPNVEFPVVTISAIYPGANPETVESKVVDKIEEAVNSVTGIKTMRSTSMENFGQVIVQFELERKSDQAVQDVRDKVSAILSDLPKDLDPPLIQKFDIGAAPIMSLVVSGDKGIRELTRIAKDVVKQKLQTLKGVGNIDIVGGREREFHIWLDPRRLESRHLTAFDVMQAIGAQNIELPGGRLNIGNQEYVLKTEGEVHSKKELEDIIITAQGGSPIRIRDIARVEDGEEEERSYSSLSGKRAVSLVVRKQSGENTVQMAHIVRKEIAQLQTRLKKAGIEIKIPIDNSTFIEHSINDVKFDLLLGGVLAVIIILLFLHDWRATFISALALPTSVIATFAFVNAMGFTFNQMTMLALSLSIGILVDDAIVVIEAIHRHVDRGLPPMKAASVACKEIGLAVMATTASIVAVFVPVAFMQGIIGRFFLQFGLTVAFAVSVSLFVAFSLTPMLAARMLKTEHKTKGLVARFIDRILVSIDNIYRKTLALALRHRGLTILIGVASLIGSCSLLKVVKTEFLPPEDRAEFAVKVELKTGTDLKTTKHYVNAITEEIRKTPGVRLTFTTLGAGAAQEVNKAEIQVILVKKHQRSYSQDEMMEYMRKLLTRFPEAKTSVERIDAVAGGGGFRQQQIQFNIRGNNYDELNKAASTLMQEMKKSGGYVDMDTTYRGGKPEIRVNIDRDRAADLGIPVQMIAATLRAFIAGDKISELTTDGDRFDIRIRLPDEARRNPQSVTSLRLRTASGQLVPLSSVVTIAKGSGPSAIDRQNRQRQVTVLANLEGKALGEAINEVNSLGAKVVPKIFTTDWAGRAEVMKESFGHMIVALLLAIIIIYMILAAQFESFLHPLTIMLSLPLSVVGALGGLAIAVMTLNIFSMIGIIMLMGLVTKNAILLIDYTIHIRHEKGLNAHQALMEAGPVRLRPILMTTAAMIGGMIPVALALSEGGEQRAPMAVVVIGGLITSTLLTLIVVPVVYSLFDALSAKLIRRK